MGATIFWKKSEEKFGGVKNFWFTLLKGRLGEEECCFAKIMLLLRRTVFFPLWWRGLFCSIVGEL
jgi:hypothetical protein